MTQVISHTLSLFELIDLNRPENIFTTQIRYLKHWSRSIENLVIQSGLSGDFYAGFQHISRFARHKDRYTQIARTANTWVFASGEIDASFPAGIRFVPLYPDEELARYWFVIADCDGYRNALIAWVVPESDSSLEQHSNFRGLRTSNPETIRHIADYLQQRRFHRISS